MSQQKKKKKEYTQAFLQCNLCTAHLCCRRKKNPAANLKTKAETGSGEGYASVLLIFSNLDSNLKLELKLD